MPFDIENAVKWNANYLKDILLKRDTNVEQLKPLVEKQSKDIANFTLTKLYNIMIEVLLGHQNK